MRQSARTRCEARRWREATRRAAVMHALRVGVYVIQRRQNGMKVASMIYSSKAYMHAERPPFAIGV